MDNIITVPILCTTEDNIHDIEDIVKTALDGKGGAYTQRETCIMKKLPSKPVPEFGKLSVEDLLYPYWDDEHHELGAITNQREQLHDLLKRSLNNIYDDTGLPRKQDEYIIYYGYQFTEIPGGCSGKKRYECLRHGPVITNYGNLYEVHVHLDEDKVRYKPHLDNRDILLNENLIRMLGSMLHDCEEYAVIYFWSSLMKLVPGYLAVAGRSISGISERETGTKNEIVLE